MLDAAKNKLRVKISYVMIALTVVGCVLMVIEGKQVREDFLSLVCFPQRAYGKSGIDSHIYSFEKKRLLLHKK